MKNLSPEAAKKRHDSLDHWTLEPTKIAKEFTFKDFGQAMGFVNRVAEVAEAEDHHPDIDIRYNKVKIALWTHASNGLTENDFILAAKVDAIISGK